MCRDNNFSHHCQKIFINSLRAPKKEQALLQYPTQQTPRVSPMTLSAFLLCIPQIVEQNRDRSQSTMKLLAPEQVFNLSYIYRELSNLFRNWYIPGSHVPFIVHISRWRMDTLHYHRFVIIDSVDNCFKLKKWRLGIRNSGSQKHERHDLPCFNLSSWDSRILHTMRGSSERNRRSFYIQEWTLSTYHGLKSANNYVQYLYPLT